MDLAGAYNSNVLRAVYQTIQKRHKSNDEFAIIAIGRVGVTSLRNEACTVILDIVGACLINRHLLILKKLRSKAVGMFTEGTYDELYMYYNHLCQCHSTGSNREEASSVNGYCNIKQQLTSYEFEPSAEGFLEVLLPQYAESLIYGALLDGKASEHAARMTAMKSATDNAKELIDNLTLIIQPCTSSSDYARNYGNRWWSSSIRIDYKLQKRYSY